jgi:CubicO group peptidase (beta-lactamase class C family)
MCPDRIFDPSAYLSGGTGLMSTADDYLRFLEAIRHEDEPKLLANLTGAIPIPVKGPGWGHGLIAPVVTDARAAGVPMGNGSVYSVGGYGHICWIDPKAELSVVSLTNTCLEGMVGQFAGDVRNAVYAGLQ